MKFVTIWLDRAEANPCREVGVRCGNWSSEGRAELIGKWSLCESKVLGLMWREEDGVWVVISTLSQRLALWSFTTQH